MGRKGKSKGLFDMHVHGGGGYTFATSDPEKILKAYRAQKEHGTSHLLATYVSLPYQRLRECLRALREAMESEKGIVGAYIEGPFINPQKAGGMRKDYITCWEIGQFKRLIEEFADVVRLVVVAPEMDLEGEVFRILRANGVKVAVGHSEASYEEAMSYAEKGVFAFTHIYNAMGRFHHRSPGVVAVALLSDAYCELIPEPNHVHPAAMEMAMRLKGDKLIPVSDGTPLAAGGPEQMKFGGQLVARRGGACYNQEGRLYGSAITLREGMDFLVENLKVDEERLTRACESALEELLR